MTKQTLVQNLQSYIPKNAQCIQGMCILPLVIDKEDPHTYISLHTAMAQGTLQITEINQGGSVPNLLVKNLGMIPILILDGEELKGAKQNRVLNTTVLVPPLADVTIPVSCTEQGRWQYTKPLFEESGQVLSASMRASKMHSVSENLKYNSSFASDQSEVWHNISLLQAQHKHQSGTSAMEDVFIAKEKDLEEICAAFPLLEGQCGIYVEIGGHFAGFDLVSIPTVWSDVHQKITRSYAIDILHKHPAESKAGCTALDSLNLLLAEAKPNPFMGVGWGEELRFEHHSIIGSALLWEEHFVHTALYPHSQRKMYDPYSSPRSRRDHEGVVV